MTFEKYAFYCLQKCKKCRTVCITRARSSIGLGPPGKRAIFGSQSNVPWGWGTEDPSQKVTQDGEKRILLNKVIPEAWWNWIAPLSFQCLKNVYKHMSLSPSFAPCFIVLVSFVSKLCQRSLRSCQSKMAVNQSNAFLCSILSN